MICPNSNSWIGEENRAGSRDSSVSMSRLLPIWGSPDKRLHHQMNLLLSRLDEQQQRWYVALQANKLGAWWRRLYVIGNGVACADYLPWPRGIGRRVGRPSRRWGSSAGRRTNAGRKKTPAIEQELLRLTEGETGGHPITGRKWVGSSQRNLSLWLGGRISHHTVGRLLRELGFSPRVNRKRFTGSASPGSGPAIPPDSRLQLNSVR